MLPNYGVTIGMYAHSEPHQGRWLQELINLTVNSKQYQCNVDVNEANGSFQYMLLNDLDAVMFQNISSLPDGYHELERNSTSGAIDYLRSLLIQRPQGCLALIYIIFNWFFGQSNQVWKTVTGDEAGNALVGLITGSQRIYVFGAPYTNPNPYPGAHDVHCNQGDTDPEFQPLDGVWQDGCVIAQKDGKLAGYFGKFSDQNFPTDNVTGLPL